MNVGQTVGSIGGTIAGGALLGALDGPLPFMDVIGAGIGGAIGGDIGKALGGKGKRMAGQMLDPRILAMNVPMVNPNTQMMAGMGVVDPNPSKVLQEYAMY